MYCVYSILYTVYEHTFAKEQMFANIRSFIHHLCKSMYKYTFVPVRKCEHLFTMPRKLFIGIVKNVEISTFLGLWTLELCREN